MIFEFLPIFSLTPTCAVCSKPSETLKKEFGVLQWQSLGKPWVLDLVLPLLRAGEVSADDRDDPGQAQLCLTA